MADFELTYGSDTVTGTDTDDTVYGVGGNLPFPSTLNSEDRLTGGAGTDTLLLLGPGYFPVSDLAVFTGFEVIRINNDGSASSADLSLGNQSLSVIGAGRVRVYLGSGAVTC